MTELINNEPMTIGKIISKSFKFIFKNILWITVFGFLIGLARLIAENSMSSIQPDDYLSLVKYGLFLFAALITITPLLVGTAESRGD